jgi:hypothetical protein
VILAGRAQCGRLNASNGKFEKLLGGVRRRAFIVSLLASAGCRSRNGSTGDFAQFFVSEVRSRGGRTLDFNALPVIESRWRVERDDFGFQVHLFGVAFEQVDSFMTRVLGEPKIATK